MAIDGSLYNISKRTILNAYQADSGYTSTLKLGMLGGNVTESNTEYKFVSNIVMDFDGWINRIIWEQGYFYWYEDDLNTIKYGPYQQGYYDAPSAFTDKWFAECTWTVTKESRAKRILPYAKVLGIARPDIPAAGMGNCDNHYGRGDYWIYGNSYALLDITGFASYNYGQYDATYSGVALDSATMCANASAPDTVASSGCPFIVGATPSVFFYSGSTPIGAKAIYVYNSSGQPVRAKSITVYDSSGKPKTKYV